MAHFPTRWVACLKIVLVQSCLLCIVSAVFFALCSFTVCTISVQMSLIFSAGSLAEIHPPCVLQSFVNHGAVLHKVFVVGDRHFCVERPSLKNFPTGPCGQSAPDWQNYKMYLFLSCPSLPSLPFSVLYFPFILFPALFSPFLPFSVLSFPSLSYVVLSFSPLSFSACTFLFHFVPMLFYRDFLCSVCSLFPLQLGFLSASRQEDHLLQQPPGVQARVQLWSHSSKQHKWHRTQEQTNDTIPMSCTTVCIKLIIVSVRKCLTQSVWIHWDEVCSET